MKERFQKICHHIRLAAEAWFQRFGLKILLSLGIFAALALSFEGGFLIGRDRAVDPIVISEPTASSVVANLASDQSEQAVRVSEGDVSAGEKEPIQSVTRQGASEEISSSSGNAETCTFVGSRNSDKYHLPKCSWAKRIKPENRVCFVSAADAESKGYKAGCVK